ncbi:MAG TPA: twin-arginine translocation signal domain-containing protein [Candidatus Limnocylindrales bacterium]|nr:twin-arginine translocation signal domain-containing protein [Candidatus Limnocylindrales bacterium]
MPIRPEPQAPPSPPAGISRRRFLAGAGLATVALVAACESKAVPSTGPNGNGPDSGPEGSGSTGSQAPLTDGTGAYAELLRAVRGSPDHLPRAAAALVTAGDPDAIIDFVRDRITTYPAADDSPGDTVNRMRFGARGTLRGGAGTFRDKAELLADLLRQTGRRAEVVEVDVANLVAATPGAPADLGSGAHYFKRVVREAFAPDITPQRLAAVRQLLDLPAQAPAQAALDPAGANAAALADSLLSAIDAAGLDVAAERPYRDAPITALPMVLVTEGAEKQVAEPWTGSGLRPLGTMPTGFVQPPGVPPIGVRLLGVTTQNTVAQFILVDAAIDAAAAVGRDIVVATPPALPSLDAMLVAKPVDVGVFRPMITVRGPDMDAQTMASLTTGGKPITLSGQLVDLDAADGIVRVGTAEIAASDTPDPALLASVASLTIRPNPAAFPTIACDLDARDAAGRLVEGLPAAAFRLTEDGAGVGFTISQTHVEAPRVMFLIDGSDSIPTQFRGAAMGKVARAIAVDVLKTYPTATFRGTGVYGVQAAAFDEWTADLDLLEKNVSEVLVLGSDIWRCLADAARFGPTAIVLITDAETADWIENVKQTDPKPEFLSRVRVGPPVFTLGVGNVDAPMLAKLGEAGRLGSAPVTDSASAVKAVRTAIAAIPPSPYHLTYTAPTDGAATRHVGMRVIGNPSIATQAQYDVPPPTVRARPPVLAGLYLEVDFGVIRARRTLAGVEPGTDPAVITQAQVDEVRTALFGAYSIQVEAGCPSPAVQLDDALSMAVSAGPLGTAQTSADLIAALAKGIGARPRTLHATSVPLDDAAGPLTFETNLRMTLHTSIDRPDPDAQNLHRHTGVDILPHTTFATVESDPVRAFQTTARRTARLALAEAAAFPSSTIASMQREALVVAPGSILDVLTPLGVERPKIDAVARVIDGFGSQPRLAVIPKSADLAGWYFDRANGSLFGVLWNGAGGAEEVEEIKRVFDQIDRTLTMAGVYNDVAGLLGFGGLSLAGGAWLTLEATKLKKLGAATVAIATLEDGSVPLPSDLLSLNELGCNLLQSLAMSALPDVIGALGGTSPEEIATIVSLTDELENLSPIGHGLVCGGD